MLLELYILNLSIIFIYVKRVIKRDFGFICDPSYQTSINSGKSAMMSRDVNVSVGSPGVQNTSTALVTSPSSTLQLLAMLFKTACVPAKLKPAPSKLNQ